MINRVFLVLDEEEEESTLPPSLNPQLDAILRIPLPAFKANIRRLTRKEWASEVRKLFKSIGVKGVSVTTPSYSMAQSISVELPTDVPEHDPVHANAEIESRKDTGPYLGMVHYCPFCHQRKEARDHIETIILAAFPDLNDRSDLQSDSFDYCLSIS